MPNWCECDLEILGIKKELKRFSRFAKTKKGKEINVLDTNKFIPYPKKLGYKEVELSVKNAYNTSQDYYSSAFDIIASYIKAQKILYMEAFNHCTTRLNYLMLPAIFISAPRLW